MIFVGGFAMAGAVVSGMSTKAAKGLGMENSGIMEAAASSALSPEVVESLLLVSSLLTMPIMCASSLSTPVVAMDRGGKGMTGASWLGSFSAVVVVVTWNSLVDIIRSSLSECSLRMVMSSMESSSCADSMVLLVVDMTVCDMSIEEEEGASGSTCMETTGAGGASTVVGAASTALGCVFWVAAGEEETGVEASCSISSSSSSSSSSEEATPLGHGIPVASQTVLGMRKMAVEM
mmetsp:Transcript_12358/g.34254  ORF Transcript_12358/g.34254 Transcript_12358/m.34254 type:complete len:234 (-) Transcript_12358:811-1512(-)